MTRSQWMTELKKYLITLSHEDLERAVEYYNEIYEDKNEAGIPEKEIIYQFGNPRDAAKKILDDFAGVVPESVVAIQNESFQTNVDMQQQVHEQVQPQLVQQPQFEQSQPQQQVQPQSQSAHTPKRGGIPIWVIILITVCITLFIGPIIGLVATVFALFVTVWALVGTLFAVAGSLILAGLVGTGYSIYTLTLNAPVGLAQLGMSLAALGLGILLLIVAVIVLRLWIKANIVLLKLLVRFVTFGRVKIKIFKDKVCCSSCSEQQANSNQGGQQ
ncbi:MAG: DUF1700 domain-containing protein [Firmicutes bacterium]|nr:DUF1700 domain-containing protein [Bacillota bacterium]